MTAVCGGITLDKRLSGIRWPPTEAQHRRRALRGTLELQPSERYSFQWISWWGCRLSTELVERIDAVSAWENEGGA